MKKILAALAASVLGVLVLTGSPANAAVQTKATLTCEYRNGANPVNDAFVAANVRLDYANRFGSTLRLDDGHGRTWNWTVSHNGLPAASGTESGSFDVVRVFADEPGTDYLHAVVNSANGNVHCYGTVAW